MNRLFILLTCVVFLASFSPEPPKAIRLFNGKNFEGWNGDTVKTWRIENGAMVGGSLTETVPHNEFIATNKEYGNYMLKVKFKLLGHDGFINSGVQYHSERITNPAFEMRGYQADIGDGFWGCIYDESRRDKIVAQADTNVIKKALKRQQWNDYEVWTKNGRTIVKLNGVTTVDYTEPESNIPQKGLIAFQIHGFGKAEVHYKDIYLTPLN